MARVENIHRVQTAFSFVEWNEKGGVDLTNEWVREALSPIIGYSSEILKAAAAEWGFSDTELGQINLALTTLVNEVNDKEAENPLTVEMLAKHHAPSLVTLFEKILEENGSKLGKLVIKQAIENALVTSKVKRKRAKK